MDILIMWPASETTNHEGGITFPLLTAFPLNSTQTEDQPGFVKAHTISSYIFPHVALSDTPPHY